MFLIWVWYLTIQCWKSRSRSDLWNLSLKMEIISIYWNLKSWDLVREVYAQKEKLKLKYQQTAELEWCTVPVTVRSRYRKHGKKRAIGCFIIPLFFCSIKKDILFLTMISLNLYLISPIMLIFITEETSVNELNLWYFMFHLGRITCNYNCKERHSDAALYLGQHWLLWCWS